MSSDLSALTAPEKILGGMSNKDFKEWLRTDLYGLQGDYNYTQEELLHVYNTIITYIEYTDHEIILLKELEKSKLNGNNI